MLIFEYLIQMAKWPYILKGRRVKKKKGTGKRRRRRRELGAALPRCGERSGGWEGFWALLGPEVVLACGVAGYLLFRLQRTRLGGSLRANLQGQTGGIACWGEGLWLPRGRAWGGWGPPVPLI